MRMPAEWEPHERTCIGWPCRPSVWGPTLELGRAEFASVANAIAAFEPVTMVCASEEDRAGARPVLSENVECVVLPMDGSWLRDNGPIYVVDESRRMALHFRFNGWGERHAQRDRDAALGASLAQHLGDDVRSIDIVLEGGAMAVDGSGVLALTEGCVMHPTRNWRHTRDEVEAVLKESLGVNTVVWLPEGLAEDQDRDPERMYYGTDGHIDLFFDFVGPGRCLMLSVPADDDNSAMLRSAKSRLTNAGVEIIDFPFMSRFEAGGREFIAPYLNFYVCNNGVIVPVPASDPDMDDAALSAIAEQWPDREVVSIQMNAGPMQGGAVHCMTQQVPAKPNKT